MKVLHDRPLAGRPPPPEPMVGAPWAAAGTPGGAERRTARRVRHRLRAVLVPAVLLVVGGAAVLAAVLLSVSNSVQVSVDGEVLSLRTFEENVAGVLGRLDVEVGPADRVEPAPDTRVHDGLRIVVDHAKHVEVVVDDSPPQMVVAVVDTVADVLRAAELEELLQRTARIDPAPDAPVADAARVVVELPALVTLTADGERRELETFADTVGATLAEAGVDLGAHDRLDPPSDQLLDGPTRIVVQRVELVEEVVEVPIEHGEQRRDTDALVEGETEVHTEGRDGRRREVWEVTMLDGEVAHRELVTEQVVTEPSDRVVLVGTASPVREAQELLSDLGYPAGPVDGVEGAQTRRALCAWRRLEGDEVGRDGLRPGELEALRATTGLPAAPSGRGVSVDKTCQTIALREAGQWQRVEAASTGRGGLPRAGEYRIRWRLAGWHTSTLYPAARPNMYNSMFFHGSIAIHGARHVPTHPASAGCVRVTPAIADVLFARLQTGDPVTVVGAY